MSKTKQEGSLTAKNGFATETEVVEIFNGWKTNKLAKKWLKIMDCETKNIKNLKAHKVNGRHKTDLQIEFQKDNQKEKVFKNLQIKLVSNKQGYNQIDKGWVSRYKKLWNINPEVVCSLKHFCGEAKPKTTSPKDPRRMFMNEFSETEQKKIFTFFSSNRKKIISDILKGRGEFQSSWFLIIWKNRNEIHRWTLKSIDSILDFFGGNIEFTKKGNLKIGKITMQRKGGDGGRSTANMIQFKINPSLLFEKKKVVN